MLHCQCWGHIGSLANPRSGDPQSRASLTTRPDNAISTPMLMSSEGTWSWNQRLRNPFGQRSCKVHTSSHPVQERAWNDLPKFKQRAAISLSHFKLPPQNGIVELLLHDLLYLVSWQVGLQIGSQQASDARTNT